MRKAMFLVLPVLGTLMLFGPPRAIDYVMSYRDWTADYVEAKVPTEVEFARLESLLKEERTKTARQAEKVAAHSLMTERMRASIGNLERELDQEQSMLSTAMRMLKEAQPHYFVGERRYSYAEVNRDALMRNERCQGLREELDDARQVLRDMEADLNSSEKLLARSDSELRSLERRLERLKSKDSYAELRLQFAEIASDLRGSTSLDSSELESGLSKVEARIHGKERRALGRMTGESSPTIDYENLAVTRDALSVIKMSGLEQALDMAANQ